MRAAIHAGNFLVISSAAPEMTTANLSAAASARPARRRKGRFALIRIPLKPGKSLHLDHQRYPERVELIHHIELQRMWIGVELKNDHIAGAFRRHLLSDLLLHPTGANPTGDVVAFEREAIRSRPVCPGRT